MAISIVLGLIGLVVVSMGLNVGLGGIPTLGWFGSDEFMLVAGVEVYDAQDNHIRFLGGLWFAVGLVFIAGAFKRQKLQYSLILLCLMVGVAGLFRWSVMEIDIVLNAALLPSMTLEIIGFPLLAFWLWRSEIKVS